MKNKKPRKKPMQVRSDFREIIKDTRSEYPLRQVQEDVSSFAIGMAKSEKLIDICERYQEKHNKKENTLGISWNQTTYSLEEQARVCIYRDAVDKPFSVLINPHIVKYSVEETISEEGCLSLPGKTKKVRRKSQIVVGHLTKDGIIETTFDDFEAIVVQQEIDHLNGILIIDAIRR